MKHNHSEKFHTLRAAYPFFKFESQGYHLSKNGLNVEYVFNLSDRFYFKPSFYIPRKDLMTVDEHFSKDLSILLFNIGLIELISYWKLTCSPLLIIAPFSLTPHQISFWKKLYFNGLAEFFYLNSISADEASFMQIQAESGSQAERMKSHSLKGLIIPIGGGKDSAVTLEILGTGRKALPLIMNPRKATLETIAAKGYDSNRYFEIQRSLDPRLLQMNSEGYLNGHTPFSALLAFYTLLAASMTGRCDIALSNESSANEATIEGTTINHQYSKSVAFESDFRKYVRQYISGEINYFSFLRPLNELRIAALFSGYTAYHALFRSCNAGSKTDSWCGHCAKCLFTYIILSPFLSSEALINIFGKNLLEEESDPVIKTLFDQLTGIAEEKPFDCIGTIDEVNLALCETLRRTREDHLPSLLNYYKNSEPFHRYNPLNFQDSLNQSDPEHFLSQQYLRFLTDAWNLKTAQT
ncbi:MAG TPA: hypothetical protein PKN12_05250 [Bacteroidales bacterium]|nr:hypothetical protein [Bacteroidales bacterium]